MSASLIFDHECFNYQSKDIDLPTGFYFKTLDSSYLDEIYLLLINHYTEDSEQITRFCYPKDYLYWYLKEIPLGLIVGLIYKKVLVGIITAKLMDMIIFGEKMKIYYVNLLCLQKKVRSSGLASMMIKELKNRIQQTGLTRGFFITEKKFPNAFSISENFVIPINHSKLKEIGFLDEETIPIKDTDEIINPLSLLKENDPELLNQCVFKLNKFMEKFDVKPYLTKNNVKNYLLSKKNIVYTFVKKNENEITDLISVYKNYYYCIDSKKIINVAQLSVYFYETMSLTKLITYLLDKLTTYHFDQLVFKDCMDNHLINITKFSTGSTSYYYLCGIDTCTTDKSKLAYYPL